MIRRSTRNASLPVYQSSLTLFDVISAIFFTLVTAGAIFGAGLLLFMPIR